MRSRSIEAFGYFPCLLHAWLKRYETIRKAALELHKINRSWPIFMKFVKLQNARLLFNTCCHFFTPITNQSTLWQWYKLSNVLFYLTALKHSSRKWRKLLISSKRVSLSSEISCFIRIVLILYGEACGIGKFFHECHWARVKEFSDSI